MFHIRIMFAARLNPGVLRETPSFRPLRNKRYLSRFLPLGLLLIVHRSCEYTLQCNLVYFDFHARACIVWSSCHVARSRVPRALRIRCNGSSADGLPTRRWRNADPRWYCQPRRVYRDGLPSDQLLTRLWDAFEFLDGAE